MTTFTTPEQFAAANKANIEGLLTLANSAFARAERLAALNLNTARSALEDGVASTKTLLAAKNPQELINLQATLTRPTMDKAVAYARSVYEIVAEGQQEVAKLFKAQFDEANKAFAVALDKAAKSAPAGSESAFAAVKSAFSTANSIYENVSKAAAQASEIAEANVAAATDATVKAVSASVKTTEKGA